MASALVFIFSLEMEIIAGKRKENMMRSPKVLFIGSIITDVVLIIYLLSIADKIGFGFVLLLSALLLGGTFLTYKLINRS